jgi:hypothetical protein
MTIADEVELQRLREEAKARGVEPWQVLAMRATPDNLIRDLVADSRTRVSEPRSMAAPMQSSEPEPWRSNAAEVPKGPPPGISLIDAMCDAQDKRDHAATIRRAIEDRAVEVLLREKKP